MPAAFCAVCLFQRHVYTSEQILAWCERKPAAIYFETDDSATRAAVWYLAYSLEQTFGVKPEIVTERVRSGRYISILCGAEDDGTLTENEQDGSLPSEGRTALCSSGPDGSGYPGLKT